MSATRVPIGDAQIRVLLALLAVYGEHGRATVRTVARGARALAALLDDHRCPTVLDLGRLQAAS